MVQIRQPPSSVHFETRSDEERVKVDFESENNSSLWATDRMSWTWMITLTAIKEAAKIRLLCLSDDLFRLFDSTLVRLSEKREQVTKMEKMIHTAPLTLF